MKGAAPACVIGDIDLVRPLALAGVECAVMAPEGDPSLYSRATRWRLRDVDHWSEPDALVSRLLQFAARAPSVPVLYNQSDSDLLVVSRRRSELAPAFRFDLADADLIEDLLDKARWQARAERAGLPIPPARTVTPYAGDDPALDLPFPVIVKPVLRSGLGAVAEHGKARRVENADELGRLWPALARAGATVMVQSLVEGPESRIESYHAYVGADGGVIADFTGRKLRTQPAEYGFTTAVETTDARDVQAAGGEAIERLGLTGVAKVDFKRGPDGRLWILEVNPRFNMWHHVGAVAGVNIPAFVHADQTGGERPVRRRARPGVTWCHPVHDRWARRATGVPLGHWLNWMLRSDAKSSFAMNDPMPLVRAFLAPAAARRVARLTGRSV